MKIRKNLPKLIITLLVFIVIVFSYAYHIYSHEIISAADISLKVKQFQKVDLPPTISAILKNKTVIQSKVKWNCEKISANSIGKIKIIGSVSGYSKPVAFTLDVHPFITAIEDISETISKTQSIDLPNTLVLKDSDNKEHTLAVNWNTSKIDNTKAGKYVIYGNITNYDDANLIIDNNLKAKCNLSIISNDEIVNNLIVKNELSDKPESIKAINSIKLLPTKVLNKLTNDKVSITFVNSLEAEGTGLGVYYPSNQKIRIDYIPLMKMGNISFSMVPTGTNAVSIHEIGHAFDYNKTSDSFQLSSNDEFNKIMNIEKLKLFNSTNFAEITNLDYYLDSPQEYFAECFSYYFLNNNKSKILFKYAPLTFNYIKKVTEDNR